MLRLLRRMLRSAPATARIGFGVSVEGSPGRPIVKPERWSGDRTPAEACPTGALAFGSDPASGHDTVTLSYAACVFCGRCAEASRDQVIEMTSEVAAPETERAALVTTFDLVTGQPIVPSVPRGGMTLRGETLRRLARRRFGRSVNVCTIDAGSCGGCDAEIQALLNPIYDAERFGIQFVHSPRQADVLAVTGPATLAMESALRMAVDAMPEPRAVVAVGACGCSGGIFREAYGALQGIDQVLRVDVYVPGCPPSPEALLHGLLLAVTRLQDPPRLAAQRTANS